MEKSHGTHTDTLLVLFSFYINKNPPKQIFRHFRTGDKAILSQATLHRKTVITQKAN